MQLVTNPAVSAVSAAPFRSLAVGNLAWLVTNDTVCGGRGSSAATLALTSCADTEFTCNNGLCVDIEDRWVRMFRCRCFPLFNICQV